MDNQRAFSCNYFCIQKKIQTIGIIFVLCIPIVVRTIALPTAPFSDEGFYGFWGMLAADSLFSGNGLPPVGTLQLHSILGSFVFLWDINHTLALRLVDMIVAVPVAWQVYRLFSEESGSTFCGILLAIPIVFVLNFIFAGRGNLNAISFALLPTLFALRIGLKNVEKNNNQAWVVCGIFAALAVLLRESFAIFIVIGAFSIVLARGWRKVFLFSVGVFFTSTLIIGIFAVARGGLGNILEAYTLFSALNNFFKALIAPTLLASLNPFFYLLSLCTYLLPLLIFLLAISIYTFSITKTRFFEIFPRFFFWTALACAPFYESFLKIGLYYTYSPTFIALAGFAAYLCRMVKFQHKKLPKLALISALFCSIILAFPQISHYSRSFPESVVKAIRMLPHKQWPQEMVEESNLLRMAQVINNIAKPGDTLTTIDGFYFLYVLTGKFPPLPTKNPFCDFGRLAQAKGFTPLQLSNLISSEPPNIIALGYACSSRLEDSIAYKALKLTPKYTTVASIEAAPIDYGHYCAVIYSREEDSSERTAARDYGHLGKAIDMRQNSEQDG